MIPPLYRLAAIGLLLGCVDGVEEESAGEVFGEPFQTSADSNPRPLASFRSNQAEVPFREEAKISLVENSRDRGERQWAVASTILLELGEKDGPPERTFDRIRAVRRLSDGAILVADGGSQQLRVFAADGRLQAQFGRRGRGPGEFMYLQSISVTPLDSIIVYDSRLHRLSIFERSGRLLQEVRFRSVSAIGNELIGRVGSNTFLFAERSSPTAGPRGVRRGRNYYVRHNLLTGRADTLGSLWGAELFVVPNQFGDWTTYDLPFSRNAFHAKGQQGWYVGANDGFHVAHVNFAGLVDRVVTFSDAEVALTPEEIRSTEAATIERLDPSPQRLENIQQLFSNVSTPDVRPAFSKLLVDKEGRLWVADWFSHFSGPSSSDRRWWVFDPGGYVLGTVRISSSIDVHDAGPSWIVGVETDELGVQRVVLLRLDIS